MNISKNIQDAIKTIVEQAVRIAPFDKTRTGVIKGIDTDTNTYSVQVDGVTYDKIKGVANLSLVVGDTVLVVFPTNNATQMIIIGSTTRGNELVDNILRGNNVLLGMDYGDIDIGTGYAQSGADMDLYNSIVDLTWVNDVIE